MSSKVQKIIFWTTTILFCTAMALSATAYFTAEAMRESFEKLGYPAYFRVQLGVFKLLGVAALLAPIPGNLKEWAYAGFFFTLISAMVAHLSVGDPIGESIPPVIMGAILGVSYYFHHQLKSAKAS